MFAVTGWSVSADSLRQEQAPLAAGEPASAKSKKRKRAGAAESVTASNVVHLYEAVVEGRRERDGGSKRQKADAEGSNGGDQRRAAKGGARPERDKDIKAAKKKKQNKQHQGKEPKTAVSGGEAAPKCREAPAQDTGVAKTMKPPKPPKPTKLTPLQASMREKLISARFRHLNETLYTRPSAEAFSLFQESPEMFGEYHEGFRRQVKVWPESPVDSFLEDIRTRVRVKAAPHGKGRPGSAAALPRAKTPLPRTAGTCTIADLGCGDGRLAESLQAGKAGLRLDVKSFDLQSPGPLVTRADMADLPLRDGSVNVAIFCLALMGTNWLDFVEEAYRVLHWRGELWVAEIKSRFGPARKKGAPVDHSVGHRKKRAAVAGAKRGKDERHVDAGAGADAEDLAVEVEGADDARRQTDVSAFVDALAKRGFLLHGDRGEAVDMSNKMFVKMHFVKGAAPTTGKGASAQTATKGAALKWTADGKDHDGDGDAVDEAAILKPCVYKIR